ncbi:MAG: hypothetical protein KAR40_08075 [Candidatus Sabulitectum sp.]|nr:hypothetical protein [Candidatus Sabulitectum sp.]
MNQCTFKVMVRKTIQAQPYEPVVVELSMESTCPRDQVVMEYGKAFAEIKGEMNQMFSTSSPAEDCLA